MPDLLYAPSTDPTYSPSEAVNASVVTKSHSQSTLCTGVSNHMLTYTLRPASVLKLSAPIGMVLVIVGGTAWVTLGQGPHGQVRGCTALYPASGDAVAAIGDAIPIAAGAYVVLEPLGDVQLQFAWVPEAQTLPSKAGKPAGLAATVWALVRSLLVLPLRRQDWRQQLVCL